MQTDGRFAAPLIARALGGTQRSRARWFLVDSEVAWSPSLASWPFCM